MSKMYTYLPLDLFDVVYNAKYREVGDGVLKRIKFQTRRNKMGQLNKCHNCLFIKYSLDASNMQREWQTSKILMEMSHLCSDLSI